jgi:type IV secretory pathway VirB10-like protein
LVVVSTVLVGAVMVAVAMSLRTRPGASGGRTEASVGVPAPPLVPDAIRNAPSTLPAKRDGGSPERLAGLGAGRSAPPPLTEEQKLHLMALEQELKAENAGILFEAHGGGDSASARGQGPDEPSRGPSFSATAAPVVPAPPPGLDADPNGQERKNAFLGSSSSETSSATLQHPRSPYEIQAGTIIPAVLITAINSDLPGPVIGQVRENVYDSATGNFLLVPQGAKLLAHYDSMVAWGQERVLLCWQRIVFPNGDSLNLQCQPAAPQVVARNAAGEINGIGQQTVRRNLNIQPTITVRSGFSVNVVVTKDLVVPPYPAAADDPAGLR